MTLRPLLLKTAQRTRLLIPDEGIAGLERIEGLYGREPSLGDVTFLRQRLLDHLTRSLRAENAEAWFLPRFLGATGVFVGVFFVLSFAIRDPLPFVDEALIALLTAGLVFWSWSRAGLESLEFKHRLSRINRIVSEAAFFPSPQVQRMESLLEEVEGRGFRELFDAVEGVWTLPPQGGHPLVDLLERNCRREWRRWERSYPLLKHKTDAQKAAWVESVLQEGLDLPLLYLTLRVRSEAAAFLPSSAAAP